MITGAGKAFSGGADIKEFGSPKAIAEPNLLSVILTLENSAKPVVAAVHSVVMGGGLELALGAHYRIAAPGASVALPEVKLGLIPGAGGTQRLVHAIGKSKAMALLLTGDFMDARKACDVGIVAEVTADGQALPTALAMARRIAANSPLAVALAKDAALASFETPLAQGLEHEKRNFLVALRSADNLEGQAAFLGKRTPHFTGQ